MHHLYQTGICTVTFQKDNFRNNLLYLPAISIISLLWLGIGYEIVGGRINPLVLAAFGAPVIGTASNSNAITDNFIFANQQFDSVRSVSKLRGGDSLLLR